MLFLPEMRFTAGSLQVVALLTALFSSYIYSVRYPIKAVNSKISFVTSIRFFDFKQLHRIDCLFKIEIAIRLEVHSGNNSRCISTNTREWDGLSLSCVRKYAFVGVIRSVYKAASVQKKSVSIEKSILIVKVPKLCEFNCVPSKQKSV